MNNTYNEIDAVEDAFSGALEAMGVNKTGTADQIDPDLALDVALLDWPAWVRPVLRALTEEHGVTVSYAREIGQITVNESIRLSGVELKRQRQEAIARTIVVLDGDGWRVEVRCWPGDGVAMWRDSKDHDWQPKLLRRLGQLIQLDQATQDAVQEANEKDLDYAFRSASFLRAAALRTY